MSVSCYDRLLPACRRAEERAEVPRSPGRSRTFRCRSTTSWCRPAESPLARPFEIDGVRVGNRFCILPMEGWDGTPDGEPSDLTRRRWRNFGLSGAKLMWGGEAVAVRHDGRANPNQLLLTPKTQQGDRRAARRADRRAPRAVRRERRRRPLRRAAADALGPLVEAERLRSRRADRRVPNPVLDRRVPAGVRVFDGRRARRARRRLRRRGAAGVRRRVSVRRRQGLPRLSRPRAARRARARRAATAASLENRMRFMRTRHRGDPRRGAGPLDRRAAVGVRHGAVPEAS